jgi:hypothetical protein
VKGRPNLPDLICLKITGPGELNLIKKATNISKGKLRTIPVNDAIISNNLFINFLKIKELFFQMET